MYNYYAEKKQSADGATFRLPIIFLGRGENEKDQTVSCNSYISRHLLQKKH
jgi:hypothetical protein